MMIFVIDDDSAMRECVSMACGENEVRTFGNAIEAMSAISEGVMPDMIFLDILLDGPDGFTFLHELVSYADTVVIPVVVISSLDFKGQDLSSYGVVGALSKETMTPNDIRNYVREYVNEGR